MIGKINDAYELVKNGLEVEVSLATAEQKGKLADAKLALADIKLSLAELKNENEDLRQSLREKKDIYQESSCYVRQQGEKKFALCSNCWEGEGLAISLVGGSGAPDCPRCKNYYPNVEEGVFDNLK